MISRLIAVAVALVALLVSYCPRASADAAPLAPSLGAHVGVEYYTWEEFDQSDTRLLRESGPRASVGLTLDNDNRRTSGLVYRLDGRGYYGDINYDGQTQPAPSVPVRSNTQYVGGRAELAGGYRFIDVFDAYSIDVLAAAGFNGWQRVIANTSTAAGSFVNGSTENYRVVYMKLGAGLFHVQGRWSHYVQLGMKRPVYTREDAHFLLSGVPMSIVVRPQDQVSFYFSWDIDRLNEKQQRTFGITIYYESLRFSQSPSVQVGGGVAYQPTSNRDQFGVQIGYYFNPFR